MTGAQLALPGVLDGQAPPPTVAPARRVDLADELDQAQRILQQNDHDARELSNAHRRARRASDAAPPAGPRERDQALPVADELAAAAPRHERGHVVAVAVTLTSAHADRWELTARPLYGHAPAWRNTLAQLAAKGRTRAYNASTPRRCTWDSADGDPPR